MKRAEQAWTTNIPQKTGKSVTTIEQFLLQHPAGEQILVIGAGPYRVNFQIVNCFECSGANLLRHYCVKTYFPQVESRIWREFPDQTGGR